MRESEARPPFVAPVRLRNLLWIPAVGGVWLAASMFGTPHLRVQYTFRGTYANPYYLVCDYWGLASFRAHPWDGECPLFVLARSRSEATR